MGLKGICRFLTYRLVEILAVVLLIIFLPNLPPYASISQPFSVSPAKPFTGKLSLNEKLNDVDLWHKGDFIGPEAFADYKGELYVSLYGGDIVKLTNNHITPVIKTGKPCKGHHEERLCGRPLGIEFDKDGNLYVADAYYGIFKIDIKTGEKTHIISVDQEIDGKKPKLPNSIALASNGDIFWSDSSTEFLLEDGIFDLLADPSGRLIHFDAKTKQNRVLIDEIHFANGVALSDDEEFVIVAETARNRIHRYYLKGPKKGTRDIFIDGLPGIPDNLKSDGKGGFLVPLLIAVDADHPSPAQALGPFPLLRRLVARLFGLAELGFEVVNKVYPCEFAQKGIHFVGHFSSVSTIFSSARVTVLRVDKSGNIVDSLHGLNKKIGHICEAHLFKDTLYLGSPFNDYIASIPLSKIGWEHLTTERTKRETPQEEAILKTTQSSSTTERTTTASSTTAAPPTTTPSTAKERASPTPKQTAPPTPKQQSSPPPPKQQTPPVKQQTTPPPTRQQTTPPPIKQQTTPSPIKQQATPSPTRQQATPAPTRQQTTSPPARQQTTSPPARQQTTSPPTKQQTDPPPPKQETASPPKQQTSPPPPKQQTPPPKQQSSPPKQETPTSVPKQQAPPPKQTPPTKESDPPVAQPIRDQTKKIPVNEL